jgi:ubiquitin carboxyl-terminal hydrolase 9/24
MDDDEELKNQCFGGDYSGEVRILTIFRPPSSIQCWNVLILNSFDLQVFDHMIKRMSFRRQKRWWNAYILFYTQTDVIDNLNAKMASMSCKWLM